MYCVKCGNKLNPEDLFCSECGTKVFKMPTVETVNVTNVIPDKAEIKTKIEENNNEAPVEITSELQDENSNEPVEINKDISKEDVMKPQMVRSGETTTVKETIEPTKVEPKKKHTALYITIAVIAALVIASIIINRPPSRSDDPGIIEKEKPETNEENGMKVEEKKPEGAETLKSSPLMNNTTWIASDGSEAIFTESRLDWYKSPTDHTDNYYSGDYSFYIGKAAVEYITTELSSYGVTNSELQGIFQKNDKYDESNFVVFDIRYDKFILDGEEQTITSPLVPWYGFLLEDGTFLDVANMNTASYYKFTKKTDTKGD